MLTQNPLYNTENKMSNAASGQSLQPQIQQHTSLTIHEFSSSVGKSGAVKVTNETPATTRESWGWGVLPLK